MILRRDKQQTADDGQAHCDMCGQIVPVGSDGRCGLGHRAAPPRTTGWNDVAPDPEQAVPPENEPLPTDEPLATAGVEDPLSESAPEPSAEILEPEDDPFAGLYGAFDTDPDRPAD